MKLFHKILATAASILALSSCVEEALSPLTGKYPKPESYELNTLVAQSVEKGEKTRTFTVEVSGQDASLKMKFVGDKYFLAAESYTAAPADAAKKGNYLVGNGGSTFTIGGKEVGIESGTLVVKQNDADYEMSGTLWLADESAIKVTSAVQLVYEADPEPVVMDKVASTRNNVKDGGKTVTINLATADVQSFSFDWVAWSGFIAEGSGQVFSLDLYSTDGYIHEGTYTAGDSNNLAEGQFGTTYSLFDYFPNHGTCLWDVNNGVLTPTEITAGTVTVTRKGNKWVIEYIYGEGKGMIWVKFQGAIDDLTDPSLLGGGPVDDTEYVELTKLQSAQSNVANGVKSLTINMATDGFTVTYDAANNYAAVYEGEGNYLSMDIYSEDGKLYTGTYNANTVGGVLEAGQFGIGYDTTVDWGWGPMEMKDWGTCWWTVDNAAPTAEKVTDGTVVVAVEGDKLVIKLKSTIANAKFTYPVADFKDGQGNAIEVVNLGGGEEPEPTPEYEEYTKLLVVQPNQGYDETGQPTGTFSSFTLKVGTDGMYTEIVNNGWYDEQKIMGTGNVLSIDFYTADGTLAAGTYEACAVGGTIGEGEFGIGYDVEMWGQQMVWGTCVTPYENSTAGAIEKVLDGTITVEISGDEYTITLESSVINAQYVGTLTL